MPTINLGRVVGEDGKNASINGVNALTIAAGDNINLVQTGSTLKIGAKTQTATQVGAIPVSEKGKANGVATLGADGRLSEAQIPDEADISDVGLSLSLTQFEQQQNGYKYDDETHIASLAMDQQPWPFNNKPTTIGLKKLRENVNYSVKVNVLSYSGGRLGNITVVDRARNGFKLLHDGSATSVTVGVRISGGMIGTYQ